MITLKRIFVVIALISLLISCTTTQTATPASSRTTTAVSTPTSQSTPLDQPTAVPTATQTPRSVEVSAAPTSTVEVRPSITPTLSPDDWQNFPVVPAGVSEKAKAIYQTGLANGNDPQRFSKIGDCQNINTFFLALYDDPASFTLGDTYQPLQDTIDYYSGSWSWDSIAVRGGFNVATVFNPWFSDKDDCNENESPVDCELRVNHPSVVLISMEAWWKGDPLRYEGYLRKIVETVISYNAVPILATKADNLEGENQINREIAQIAYEYEIPLWNFWRAVQDIPRKGLEDDMFHLTHGINDFSNPTNLKQGWPQRNLTALQAIDAVRRALQQP